MCICVRSTFVSHICIRYILYDTRVCMCIAYITYVTIQQMCICVRNTLVSHICIRMFSHMTQYTWCIYVIFLFLYIYFSYICTLIDNTCGIYVMHTYIHTYNRIHNSILCHMREHACASHILHISEFITCVHVCELH